MKTLFIAIPLCLLFNFTSLAQDNMPSQSELDHQSLIMAVSNGHITEARELLDKGSFNINDKDEYGYTALYYATKFGRKKIVKMLIEYGANTTKKNSVKDNRF